ncbi:MAG: chorismate mutase [Candidatus Symbiobacter sp.]|nr:chorismate mutase [Candidatus Symbiobacter sp.]
MTAQSASLPPIPSPSPSLPELRVKIDEIDGKLFDLIQERANLAPLVIKAKQGAPIWRPAREAQIFRHLRQKIRQCHDQTAPGQVTPGQASGRPPSAKAQLPDLSLMEIWARLMTGMTSIEVDFNFALVASNPHSVDAYLRTIRTHFGALPQVTVYAKPEAALDNGDRHAIIMMPWPEISIPIVINPSPGSPRKFTPASGPQEMQSDWCHLLLDKKYEDFVIGMKLPFLPHRESMPALALLAKIKLEPSGDDCTLVVEHDPAYPQRQKLIEIKDYRDSTHPEIKPQAKIIGVYPRPMPPI